MSHQGIRYFLRLVLVPTLAPVVLPAASITWNGSASGGLWNTTRTNWNTASLNPWTSANGTANIAVFNTANLTLNVSSVYANGITFTQSAILSGGNITFAGTSPTISGAGNGTIGSVLAGSAGLTKGGTGTLTLSGANTYTGTTTLNTGTIAVANNAAFGTSMLSLGTATIQASGGSRTIANNVTLSGNTIFSGSDALTFSGNTTMNRNRTLTVDNTVAFANGILQSGGGSRNLTKLGSGTLAINGASTFRGGFALSAGTLIVGNNAAAGTGVLSLGNATIQAGGGNRTLTNAVTLAGNTTFAGSDSLTFSGATAVAATRTLTISNTGTTFTGVISGAGGLAKAGLGTLVLSGNNTYSGATNVTAGTLLVTGSTSAASVVTVSAGATLGGNGTVRGATTISGIIAPGTTGIGTLNIAGSTTWKGAASAGANTDWIFQLGAGNTADLLNITGNFLKDNTLGSNFRFNFFGTGTVGTFKLVDWTGMSSFTSGDFNYTGLGSGFQGSFAINGTQLDFTVISAIPEPSTWGAMLTLFFAGGVLILRRHGKYGLTQRRSDTEKEFGGTGAVRSVAIHGRHGGRPSSNGAKASFGGSRELKHFAAFVASPSKTANSIPDTSRKHPCGDKKP